MPEAWYPQEIRDNGFNADYTNGHSRMEAVKKHFTVGFFHSDYNIGVRGYFQWLIARDGQVYQFAEADAVCFDSGEWNDAGPGIEISYMPGVDDAIFTDAALESARALCRWLSVEWSVPLVDWTGGRIDEWTGFRGFIDHRELVQTEQHVDFWPDDAWQFIIASDVPEQEDDMQTLFTPNNLQNYYYDPEVGMVYVESMPAGTFVIAQISQADFDRMNKVSTVDVAALNVNVAIAIQSSKGTQGTRDANVHAAVSAISRFFA